MLSINPTPRQFYNSQIQLSNDHWCETCDKGFGDVISLQRHRAQHEKCNIDGCTFTAHPKVITKHIQMQHSSGLYSRISNIATAEDIQKWREERKKNYPTKANIEKKQAEIKEKIERGEKIGLMHGKKKTFSRNYDQSHCQPYDRSKKPYKKKSRRLRPKMKVETEVNLNIVENEYNLGLKPFDGISNIVYPDNCLNDTDGDNTANFSDDEEWLPDQDLTSKKNTISVCSVLSNLIENYKSSDEEGCEHSKEPAAYTNTDTNVVENSQQYQQQEIQVLNVKNSDQIQKESVSCNVDDDSGPEEIAIKKQNDELGKTSELPKTAKANLRNKTKTAVGYCNKRSNLQNRKMPYTLLEKLLAKDMRHERNVALQCVRYIIKNDYLS